MAKRGRSKKMLKQHLKILEKKLETSLFHKVTSFLVYQWTATTKRCSRCGFVLEQPMELAARVFRCPACGYTADRDVNAARFIEQLGLTSLSLYSELPTGRRKVTPLEISTATRRLVDLFNQVSFVRASVVGE
ncbi:MAG: zinc ribbon domain-containing protein [Candidatus Hermodarchaeota archaeon]